MLSNVTIKDKCSGNHKIRILVRQCQPPHLKLFASCLQNAISGKDGYEILYPRARAFDLNQDPYKRPKRSEDVLSTLTTGCSKVWLVDKCRYMTGKEMMACHSIPVTTQLARVMKTRKVEVDHVSHTMQCFLAGNSMHGANVGAMIALALFGTQKGP